MAMSNILRLRPAFSDEQPLAGLFDEELATKPDLERLRIATKADLEALRLATKADLEAFRFATKADLDTLRAELKADVETLRLDVEKLRLEVQRDLKGTEARLIGWVIGQGAAIVGVLFALLHFVGK